MTTLVLTSANIEIDDAGSIINLDLANASAQVPGRVNWVAQTVIAQFRYGRVSGPYTSGPYAYAVPTQLHCHTTSSDGSKTVQQVVDQYIGAGFGTLGISDHDLVTTQPASSMVRLLANECSFSSHVLSVGCNYLRGTETNAQNVINGILAAGGLPVIAHPKWNPGLTIQQIGALTGFVGIEIHNALCVGLSNPQTWLGFDVEDWDYLLRNYRRNIWGFSHDDFHYIDLRAGYNVGRLIVFTNEVTDAGILTALSRGDFAADISNLGVTASPPQVSGNELALSCPGATSLRFITDAGLAQETAGDTASYAITGDEIYVRAEAIGELIEPFDTVLDTANRWGVFAGTWGTANGILSQTADSDLEYISIFKRHICGDYEIACDLRLPDNGQQEQAGILVNVLNADNFYYLCLRGDATVVPNSFTFWFKNAGNWGSSPLVTVNYTPVPQTWYRVRLQYVYATGEFKARVWPVGQSEPTTWQINLTQTTIRHGAFGFRTRRKADFDNLYIKGFKTYFQPVPVKDWFEN